MAAVAVTRLASADETRRGFFLDASVGAGLSLGTHFGYAIIEDSSLGPFPMDLVEDIGGPMLHLTITPAYEWSELAAGLGFDATYVKGLVEDYGTPHATLLSLSAVGMARPRETGVMAALGFGLCVALLPELSYSVPFLLQAPSQTLLGPRAGGRLGYVFSNGFGIATSASYASLSHDHPYSSADARYKPFTLGVDVTFSGE
jgi:hypothetical protein